MKALYPGDEKIAEEICGEIMFEAADLNRVANSVQKILSRYLMGHYEMELEVSQNHQFCLDLTYYADPHTRKTVSLSMSP